MECRIHKMAVLMCVLLFFVSVESKHLLRRDDFPSGFVFGAGTSAYQVEGAADVDGRKPSVWDVYTHQGMMIDKSTGDVSADQYHHYKEDIALMKKMGLDAYRFSISWPRVIPEGRGAINAKGVAYYNNLINELLAHGIEPHVTIFHFDTPYTLYQEYGGWANATIIDDFTAFAEVCFKEFGDRVKYWTTFNEINAFAPLGTGMGFCTPPGMPQMNNCSMGNSSDTYIAGHNLVLAHMQAVVLYRQKFQGTQNGSIGISYNIEWFEPYSNSTQDIAATQRALEFTAGWLLDPLVYGDYPSIMREILGPRLPSFTPQQSQMLKQSFDFLGLMHYGTNFVKDLEKKNGTQTSGYFGDMAVSILFERDGVLIGNLSDAGLPVVPRGMQEVLEYLKLKYNNPPIIIYENGYGISNNKSLSLKEALEDTVRIQYLNDYLENLLNAVRNGSNTQGYFVWSLMDVFEFFTGYRVRYGLLYVDFNHENRTRYPKQSAFWYSCFLNKNQEIDFPLQGSQRLTSSAVS